MTQNATQSDPVDDLWSQLCLNAKLADDQAVYLLRDVCRIFGVSMSTVRRWSDAGALRSWLLGPRKRVVAIQELKRYLTEQSQNGY